jgi:hypothetical protein
MQFAPREKVSQRKIYVSISEYVKPHCVSSLPPIHLLNTTLEEVNGVIMKALKEASNEGKKQE